MLGARLIIVNCLLTLNMHHWVVYMISLQFVPFSKIIQLISVLFLTLLNDNLQIAALLKEKLGGQVNTVYNVTLDFVSLTFTCCHGVLLASQSIGQSGPLS